MKVFLIWQQDAWEQSLKGVFSTRELAEEALKALQAKECGLSISISEVDAPISA